MRTQAPITAAAAIRIATLAIWIGTAICHAEPDALIEDSFDYADATELTAGGWVTVAGTPAVTGEFSFASTASGWMSSDAAVRPATQEGFSLMRLANAAVYRQLPQTVRGDWSLTITTAMNAYSRSENIGVTDDAGNGYSLRWNGTLPTQNQGRGVLSINKLTGWAAGTFSNGTIMGSTVVSLQFPTAHELPAGYVDANPVPYRDPLLPDEEAAFTGFSTLVLTWSATTGQLSLLQYGDEDFVLLATRTDTQFSSFSRVYIGGGSSSYFDNVTFESLPEPSAAAPAAIAATALLARKRMA